MRPLKDCYKRKNVRTYVCVYVRWLDNVQYLFTRPAFRAVCLL